MTKQEKIIEKSAALMLDETERTIFERGYTGIVKYLYSGYAEFKMLMLLPSRFFAALHFNISEAQLQKRITRTKILKNAIAVFTAASVISTGLFVPVMLPFAAKFWILIAVAAGSVGFFGIMLHTLNNFIEEMKLKKITGPLTFTPFTLHEVKDMINKTKEGDIETQKQYIEKLLTYKDELVWLFKYPKKIRDGLDLRIQTQSLIENLYSHMFMPGHENEAEQLNDIVYSSI